MKKWYAKSKRPGQKQVEVKEHLQDVCALSTAFGRALGMEAEARTAGQLHDVGKYSEKFQNVLKGTASRVDHAMVGAAFLWKYLMDTGGYTAEQLGRSCYAPILEAINAHHGELRSYDELRCQLAACMEEHFPHSMAKAVMDAAKERGLTHEEMHSKVEYIVAHGISTTVNGRKAIIGSHHFVFEDEKCAIPTGKEEIFKNLPEEYSHLYLGIEGELAAVICIEDPLRPEGPEVIKALRKAGFTQIVMMTGDSDRTAKAIAAKVGVDKYYSEVLPEDKAKFVEEAKKAGFENLKGHRSVGGMRASIYNAMPYEGVVALVEFMKKFEEENA